MTDLHGDFELSRKQLLGIGGGVLASLLLPDLALASPTRVGSARAAGGTLNVAVSGGPDTLDPHVTIAGTDWVSLANIYDGLFMRDYSSPVQPARTIPGLATSYDVSPDGRTYTFHLRPNVQFHDGSPWNADAAVFNFRRWFDKSFKYYYPRANATVNGFIGGVTSYTAPDSSTLKVTLAKPNAGWFDYFTGAPTFFMVSPAAVAKYGNAGMSNAGGGTGAFKVKSYQRNQRLELVANTKWWRGPTSLDGLIISPIPDDSARVAAMLSGQYDIAQEISPDSIGIVNANNGMTVKFAGKPVTFGFAGNIKKGAWSDPLVREASSLAIDRVGLTQKVLHGAGAPATQFYGLGNPAHDPTLPIVDPYNPAKAKALLKRSKYGKGLHFHFFTSTSAMGVPEPSRILEVIQSELSAIGIASDITVMEWTAYLGEWFKGTPAGSKNDVPIYTQAMGWDTNMLLESYVAGSSQPPHGVNFAWYENPSVDKLLGAANLAKSPQQLIQRLRIAQRQMLKDRPYVYVFHGKSAYAINKSFNWAPASTWAQSFARAAKA
jgi:peptide/nickel transport system substrate-binding protein